jgi:hypothetical protein
MCIETGFGPRDGDESGTDELAAAGATTTTTDAATARQEILERLARREIGAEDAATAIRALGRTDR